MSQKISIIIVSIAVVIFLIHNHFKRQKIDLKIFIAPMILVAIFIGVTIKYPNLKFDASGFLLRFLLGIAIGVLQGYLARIFTENESESVTFSGTKIGLVFWLIFVPVRLFILPWFSKIAPGLHNLEDSSLLGISAICIFTGFFLSKGITLLIRKGKLV